MILATKTRFTKSLSQIKRRDGAIDRYWCVLDREQRGFQVLKIHATYPGAEVMAGAYALKLNSKFRRRAV